ncbi:hypothetical protein Pelo_15121 [Pelomyxa schiedti]|nr:hypothetical protein Pelo_15121 [Pelomyxa schiedti]
MSWDQHVTRRTENELVIKATGKSITIEKEESPIWGHTAGQLAHNWAQLRFGKLLLKWSDVCTESAIAYYCDIGTEFSHTLELIDEATGVTKEISVSVTNMRDATKSSEKKYPENMQHWLDAVLGGMGVPATIENWQDFAKHFSLANWTI